MQCDEKTHGMAERMCGVYRTVVFTQHTELGLEERRQCRLLGRTEARLHRSELFGARILHANGKSFHDEILQSGKRVLVTSLMLLLLLMCRFIQRVTRYTQPHQLRTNIFHPLLYHFFAWQLCNLSPHNKFSVILVVSGDDRERLFTFPLSPISVQSFQFQFPPISIPNKFCGYFYSHFTTAGLFPFLQFSFPHSHTTVYIVRRNITEKIHVCGRPSRRGQITTPNT